MKFHCSRLVINPGFGFGIEDETGRRIFSLNNYINSSQKNTFKTIQEGVVCFEIERCPLMPGNYFISVSLVEDQRDWFDFVEQAISLEIKPFDIYGTGKIPERSQGIIFIRGNIKVNDNYSFAT